MTSSDDLTRTSAPDQRTDLGHALDSGRFVAGTILASRYRIIGLAGRGGMGEVYKAEDLRLGQTVALKFLPDALTHNASALSRFQQEVRLARKVSHPNVCRVYDLVDAEGASFLTMEFIDGEDLRGLLKRIGRLPADKAIETSRQIAAGLAAAHDQGVLHRDLKPANVMIDGRGRARLTDFGLATVAEAADRDGRVAGTVAYMAPELLAGGPATVSSDLFSLGLVLYELFTGKRAFDGAGLLEVKRQHSDEVVKTPSSWVKDLDPLVERAVLRCLERDPVRRPASAAQVMAALPGGDPLQAALLAGETPSPEIVAAAGSREAMRPAAALAWLAVIVAGVAILITLSPRVAVSIQSGTLAPDALRVRGREILNTLGYHTLPIGSWLRVYADQGQRRARSTTDQGWARLLHGRPHPQQAFYRESPKPLVPIQGPFVRISDPPLGPSMTLVEMDGLGRLKRLEIVPEEWEPTGTDGSNADWSTAFQLAGLELATFTSVAPLRTPPHAADTRAAWTGHYPNQPETTVRIEASALKGRIVFFDTLEPWELPSAGAATTGSTGTVNAVISGVTVIVVLAALLIAWRNYRAGRGDRRGAVRLSVVMFAGISVQMLVTQQALATATDAGWLWRLAGEALQFGAMVCVLYFALEPYVRRRWPTSIITWSRLLAGDWRDPLVGRDVLLGVAFTVLLWVVAVLAGTVAVSSGNAPWLAVEPVNASDAVSVIAILLLDAMFTLGLFLVFVIVRTLLRRTWLAALVVWSMMLLLSVGSSPTEMALTGLMYGVSLWIAARWGLLVLALSSPHIVPALTLNPGDWYFGGSMVYLVVLAAAAWYGFRTATAGRPIVSQQWLDG